jgi:hypothetical protein
VCNAEPTSFLPNVASKLIYRNAPAEEKKVAVACKEVCGQGGIQIPGKVLQVSRQRQQSKKGLFRGTGRQ